MDIVTALATLKNGSQVAKTIAELVKQPQIDPNEIAARLLVLQEMMINCREALNEASEEMAKLREEVAENDRRKGLEADLDMDPDGQFYIRNSEKAQGKYIPYCPVCWGNNVRLVPLTRTSSRGLFQCKLHHVTFETKAYRESQQRVSSGQVDDDGPNSWMR